MDLPQEDTGTSPTFHEQEIALLAVGGGVVLMIVIVAVMWFQGFFGPRSDSPAQWTPERKQQALEELNEEAKRQGVKELSQEEKMLILNNGNR